MYIRTYIYTRIHITYVYIIKLYWVYTVNLIGVLYMYKIPPQVNMFIFCRFLGFLGVTRIGWDFWRKTTWEKTV